MISIGPFLIDEDKIHSDEFLNHLSSLKSEDLAHMLISASIRICELEELNNRRFVDGMRRKKSVGGITVDK